MKHIDCLALNQVTNDLNYSDVKYQLGLIGKMKMKNYLKQ